MMTADDFWKRIAIAHREAGDDAEVRPDTLHAVLSDLSVEELQAFQNIYDAQIHRSHRWDLWAAAYIINGGCSDDGFRYFRDWLISEGRETFEKAMANPDSLAELPHAGMAELEAFGYVALDLFEKQGGGEFDRAMSTEGTEPAGQPWDEAAVDALCPRLAEKYG